MLIFCNKCGQLGNRLFAFAHLIANAATNDYLVINLSFDEYARFFETTGNDLFCRYPARRSWVVSDSLRSALFVFNKVIFKLLRITNFHRSYLHHLEVADLPEYKFREEKFFDMNNSKFVDEATRKAIFVFGRFFRDYSNMERQQSLIREYFRPNIEIRRHIDSCYKRIKKTADIVVGVHIRKGDYKEFSDGKYFYPDEVYFQVMSQLVKERRDKKVTFAICSNEAINVKNFYPLNVFLGPGHFVEDIFFLAECDYILGPPSTFTQWASFYGNKPLYQLKDVTDNVDFDKFILLPPSKLYNFSFN